MLCVPIVQRTSSRIGIYATVHASFPSPGTAGEDYGGGFDSAGTICQTPAPSRPPEYRGVGKISRLNFSRHRKGVDVTCPGLDIAVYSIVG